MKNILINSIFALALLSFAGCYETATGVDASVKSTKSKCGSAKCGDSKKTMKCGQGKCGTAK